jgi:RHS repeat-associated protein
VSYDALGNITALTTAGATQGTPTSSLTNRLTGLGATYDAGGNLTGITLAGQQQAFGYDALNLMRTMETTSDLVRAFVYDADDERVATLECVPPATCATHPARDTWTIRGLDGKVLRTYEHEWEGNEWTWERDYVYRDGVPLATVEPDGAGAETTLHLHVDHLGSIREVTDATGSRVAYHSYYPFGGEATSTGSDAVKLKFTGHERDESGGVALDYMHARYCSPVTGRVLSVDPSRAAVRPSASQAWNRYVYVENNPLRMVDPDGEAGMVGTAGGGALIGAGIQVGINLWQGNEWDEGVLTSMATGAALGSGAKLLGAGRNALTAWRLHRGIQTGRLIQGSSGVISRAALEAALAQRAGRQP